MVEATDIITANEPWPYYLGMVVRAVRAIVEIHRPGMLPHIDRCEGHLIDQPEAALAEILCASARSCDWAATHRPDNYMRFTTALRSLMLRGGRLTAIGPDPIPVPLRSQYWAGYRGHQLPPAGA